jgi:hypothetical protein
VQNATQAVLFEPGNPQSLASTVNKLRSRGMIERVLTAQDERFSDFAIERTAQSTLTLYREVLKDE